MAQTVANNVGSIIVIMRAWACVADEIILRHVIPPLKVPLDSNL